MKVSMDVTLNEHFRRIDNDKDDSGNLQTDKLWFGVYADGLLMQNLTLDGVKVEEPLRTGQCHIFTYGHLVDFTQNYTSINQHSGTFLMHKNKLSDFQVSIPVYIRFLST